jgi:hypothetical protein
MANPSIVRCSATNTTSPASIVGHPLRSMNVPFINSNHSWKILTNSEFTTIRWNFLDYAIAVLPLIIAKKPIQILISKKFRSSLDKGKLAKIGGIADIYEGGQNL